MGFLEDRCSLTTLNNEVINSCKPFSCGKEDIDDFFHNKATLYRKQLLGKSYCFLLDEDPSIIVCAFTISNDSLRIDLLPNNRRKKVQEEVPHAKHMQRYPGTLIGQIGVNRKFTRQGIGTEMIDFIKAWLIDKDYKTGCRYLFVEAHNEEVTLNYYRKNGFKLLFYKEKQEIEFTHPKEGKLQTRLMYFDLIKLAYNS